MISPSSISAIFVTMRFMNSRSCDVMSSAPGRDFRKRSSQMIDSMSRWFVGSSISSTSGRPSSTRAIATRIFHPPDSVAHVAVDPLVVEPEAVEHLARLRLERVAAEVLVFLLHFAEAGEDARPSRRPGPDRPSRD